MSYSYIRFEPGEHGIVTLTVDRPDKLNALNRETVGELEEAIRRFESEPELRALVITGAGGKAFVAGADILELTELRAVSARAYAARGQRILRKLETCGKVSIAAVNGYALGGGLELALAATLRFASPHAKLGLPEVKLGLIPGYGGTQRLARLVGRGRALEMLLSGEPVDAGEALRIGLVNRLVPQTELLGACREWLRHALANGPLALAMAIEAVDFGCDSSLEEGLRFEAAGFGVLAATHDAAEGLRAFLEKRTPAFKGE